MTMAATNGNGIIVAFSAHQVARLTRLSLRQLSYWDSTAFFSPEYAPGYRKGAFSRVYSFRDVVGLYTISLLRKKYAFPLQQLRRVGDYLHRHHGTPWSSLALFVAGKEVLFRDPDNPSRYISAAVKGQHVIPLEMEELARQVDELSRQMRARTPSQVGRILRNRYVVHNRPVLAGTRIPTEAVWNFHTAGYETAAILREYPRLRAKDVISAVAFERRQRAKAI